MRSRPRIDPAAFDYGAANDGLRELVRAFGEVDWFVPAPSVRADEAVAAFRELQQRGARVAPELFPTPITPAVARGGWETLLSLAERARAVRGWDWRYACYRTGYLPFSFGPSEVTLFAFDGVVASAGAPVTS